MKDSRYGISLNPLKQVKSFGLVKYGPKTAVCFGLNPLKQVKSFGRRHFQGGRHCWEES